MEEFGDYFYIALSYVPPGRSGSSSPVPAYSGSSP
ncbi:hypothetical protein T01_5069 [Trichinella spiralis]|uniref:Uncharacterized protein n=1 Tax=Trichinella spiralis TaxID=6334 RepID=A0A0V0ZXF6_TRISP|nr:hypothetical protein T01_5069 [Trichinella spiralis]